MVEIDIQYDFSELAEHSPARVAMEQKIASETCGRYISTTGLEHLVTSDGKLTAMIRPGLNSDTTDITLIPGEGQEIKNIDAIMKVLRNTGGITIHGSREPETVKFSRQYGNRTVEFVVKTRTPKIEKPAKKADDTTANSDEISDTSDFGDVGFLEPAKEPAPLILPERKFGIIEIPEIKYSRSARPVLEEIAGYAVAGIRQGHDILPAMNPTQIEKIVKALGKTLAKISTSDGTKPLLAYNPDKVKVIVDVFPQKGSTITELALEGNAKLYDEQLRGIITYRSDDFRMCVHRRNLYEKFNIRGVVQGSGTSRIPLVIIDENEYPSVMEELTHLPAHINITTDNDTEVTVAYQPAAVPTRIFLTPLPGVRLVLAGLEESQKIDGDLRFAYMRKDGPGELYRAGDDGFRRSIVLFTEPTSSRAHWHEQGGRGEDLFDRFYADHTKKSQ